MTNSALLITMQAAAWEEAKGKLLAMVRLYGGQSSEVVGSREDYQTILKEVTEFISKVDEWEFGDE